VVKIVISKDRNLKRFEQIVRDIRIILNSLSSWQIHHISRIVNNAAHNLVKAAVKHIIDHLWTKKILNYICNFILLGKFALFSYIYIYNIFYS
jgi:hypothetical protein